MKLGKLLIANRGEIACRIIRTARTMGIATVAVYSEADADAVHVGMADEAYCLGPAEARDSYLNQQEILRVASASGAEAIHPGYGFLSENPEFAAACEAAGRVFIGPPPEVITSMGIKSRAREIMAQAGIPVIPGQRLDTVEDGDLAEIAAAIGYPLLIKADRGGGGKGIRLAHGAAELREAVAAARREAAGAFGDSALLLEKQVVGARHIEVQIFRDSHGNAVHLFERDCSLQRRHQKILEEAPAPAVPERLRQELHAAAVTAAQTIGYLGAGTVEFLVEASGNFYFLEINTRLQVEHPVTEMITGQDLVAWQILVASGQPLPKRQEELHCTGHAIEVRIYAEDPARDFLPATGVIQYLREPAAGPAVRVDTGVRAGSSVTPYYDPILAKLIVCGTDRQAAISTLQAALGDYRLAGVATNIEFLLQLAGDREFLLTEHTTRSVDSRLGELTMGQPLPLQTFGVAALWLQLENARKLRAAALATGDPYSPWSSGTGFRLNQAGVFEVCLACRGEQVTVRIVTTADGYRLETADGTAVVTEAQLVGEELRCRLDGKNITAAAVCHRAAVTLFYQGRTVLLQLPDPARLDQGGGGDDTQLRAPMPGSITEVFVTPGQRVRQGDALLVLVAMKMEYVLRAPADSRVVDMIVKAGDTVQEKDLLVRLAPATEVGDAAA